MINLNSRLFFLIHNLSGKIRWLDYIMVFVSEVIIYLTIIFVLILRIWGAETEKAASSIAFLAILISLILILVSHIFIKERRPFIKFGFTPLIRFYKNLSFPSIHTTIISAIFFSSLYFGSEWSLLLLILLIGIAFARIYTGLHYPIDIIGGIFTGALSVALAVLFFK